MECEKCGHEVELEFDIGERGLYTYGRCDTCEIVYHCRSDGTVLSSEPDPSRVVQATGKLHHGIFQATTRKGGVVIDIRQE